MARSLALFVSLIVAALLPGLARASLEQEWNSAVTALVAVDPSIEPPSLVPDTVQVVGGGKPILNASTAFAVSARQNATAVSGEMTLVAGFGTTYRARVVCVDAVVLPGGGGYARVNGALDEPAFGLYPTLVFFLTDSGQPGGEGDGWGNQFLAEPPAEAPCVASPGVTPIAAGNIVISAGD
jgi:hypothetical protein